MKFWNVSAIVALLVAEESTRPLQALGGGAQSRVNAGGGRSNCDLEWRA